MPWMYSVCQPCCHPSDCPCTQTIYCNSTVQTSRLLAISDAIGTTEFNVDLTTVPMSWNGGRVVQLLSAPVTTPSGVCVVGASTIGPVHVCYRMTMTCVPFQPITYTITRSWSWVPAQGTLAPIWYQDASSVAAGLPCVSQPPSACGSAQIDSSSATISLPDPPSPFVLGGVLVPDPSNHTADPIGGDVTIQLPTWLTDSTPKYCVQFCIDSFGCESITSDYNFTVSNSGGEVASGTTRGNTCVPLNVGVAGLYTIDLSRSGGNSYTFTRNLKLCSEYFLCCYVVQLSVPPGFDPTTADITISNGGGAVASGHPVDVSPDLTEGVSQFVQTLDPNAGPYTATCTYGGFTKSIANFGCGTPIGFRWVPFTPLGCTVTALQGATVHYDGDTVVTGADGYAYFLESTFGLPFTVDAPRFQHWDSTAADDFPTLQPLDGYICCGNLCNYPICKTLLLTDSVLGTCELQFGVVVPGYETVYDFSQTWNGYIDVPYPGACGCPGMSVRVLYGFGCFTPGVIPSALPSLGITAPSHGVFMDCSCTSSAVVCPGSSDGNVFSNGGGVVPSEPVFQSLICDPLDVTFTFDSRSDGCAICHGPFFPVGSTCGPANATGSLWGLTRTVVTVTITDIC